MKYCSYSLEISGNEEIIRIVRQYVAKHQNTLSETREKTNALSVIFGDSINMKIVVHKASGPNAHILRATLPENR
jgi:hypothetical protein